MKKISKVGLEKKKVRNLKLQEIPFVIEFYRLNLWRVYEIRQE